MDYAALTPVDGRVKKTIKKYSNVKYGNPSSLYAEGVAARRGVNESRARIAKLFRGLADEVFFTGSGTEANNLAIMGAYEAAAARTKNKLHAITTAVEHASVLEVFKNLEKKDVEVTYIGVDDQGQVNPQHVKDALRPNTFLISMMLMNNETGAIQPVRECAKLVRNASGDAEILFHTDASQAVAYLGLDVQTLGVDLITIDSHKVYGPRGIGMLWKKRSVEIAQITFGGGQEKELRSGTENVAAIAGFAHALEIAAQEREGESARLAELRDLCVQNILKIFPKAVVLGPKNSNEVSPHILNISFPGVDNDFLLLQLDAAGIACATKSSCLKDEDVSYVLKAMGIELSVARSALRFSFGRWSKKRHIRSLAKALARAISIQL